MKDSDGLNIKIIMAYDRALGSIDQCRMIGHLYAVKTSGTRTPEEAFKTSIH